MIKENYLSYGEIHTQYDSLKQTVDYMEARQNETADFFKGNNDIVFLACGSSYWMSLSAHMSMRIKTGRRCYAVKAGDIVLCGEEYAGCFNDPVFICPSRSGRTGEVLKAISILKKEYPAARILSITGCENSPLVEMSNLVLPLPWSKEESVCQTKSFSNLYLASVLLAETLSGSEKLFNEARRFLKNAPEIYAAGEKKFAAAAEKKPNSIVCLGSGSLYGVCIEGAYIVIEAAEFNANYYHLMEYRHGPIVTANSNTVVFMLSMRGDDMYEKQLEADVKKTGAVIYSVSDFNLDNAYSKEFAALHYIFCLQSFAFHLSLKLGNNPDSPGSLSPYITI